MGVRITFKLTDFMPHERPAASRDVEDAPGYRGLVVVVAEEG